MYQVKIDDEYLYLPGDQAFAVTSPTLNLELGGSGSFTCIVPRSNSKYDKIGNRSSMVSVLRDGIEIFYGEVRNQEKDFMGNKKIGCVGVLGYLADSIQPQKEYHDQTPRQMLSAFITEHNNQVEDRKKFTVGRVTVTDANDSLYRYSNFETSLGCIKDKLVDRLGGYLVVRHEDNKLYLDWLNIEDIGVTSTQPILFGLNILDYTEDLSSDDIATAIIPLGAEIENEDGNQEVLKQYVNIKDVNNGKNYIVSDEAYKQFGWVCAVEHWNDVHVPANLMIKGRAWLTDNQFEQVVLKLTAMDLSLLNSNYEVFSLGDKIRCIAEPYGMNRLFPVLKLSIPLDNPSSAKIELGETKAKGYIEQISKSYQELAEETETNRKITNARIKDAVDNLTEQMHAGTGGYKLTEYDEQGRWIRDLYMDTMDKDTATKVLQVNLNGIGGSKNGYAGPYNVGMTLDGQILGERIVANSITSEKLAVSYTSQVEQNITNAAAGAVSTANANTEKKLKNYYTIKEVDTKLTVTDGKIEASISSTQSTLRDEIATAKSAAISSANMAMDNKLKSYYTASQIDTKLSVTDGKIEASVESINQNLLQKNGNYYGAYTPTTSNAPANTWNTNALKQLHDGDFFFDTSTGYAYRYAVQQDVLKVTFSSNSRTEGANYDYVRFYYELNGKTYCSQNFGGTTIANAVVYIPVSNFWVYWRTDGSQHDYYGFRIQSVEKVKGTIPSDNIASLPTDAGGAVDISGTNYPESEHSPYTDNVRKLWKYVSGQTLSTSISSSWIRVKDSDIDGAVDSVNSALQDKSGNFYGTYVPNTSNEPAKNWNTNSKKEQHIGDMFYNTATGYAYRYAVTMQCLKVTFSSDSKTESANYDWVQIFYELDGKTYALPKLGGSDIKNAVVYVPAINFYVYWRSDNSNSNYYGFAITKVEKVSTYQEVKGTVTVFPTDGGEVIEVSGTNYPESDHMPYGDNVRKLWKYTSSETLSTSRSGNWFRVQDQDIAVAKTKAEEAISRITVAEGSITTMVKKGDFGTYMQQNYNSFLLGFNAASKYVQIKAGEIGLYNGTVSNTGKRAVMNESGFHFYRDNYYVGKIGTNEYSGNKAHKGLVFDLDVQGKYMAFSQKASSSATSYTTMLCFSRASSIYSEYGLHLGANLYCHGFKLIGPQWDGGSGTTATINYVQVLSVDSSGKVTKWGPNGRMVFKNGILMDLTYYSQ